MAVREYLVAESVLASSQKPEGQINKIQKAKYSYHKAEPWAKNIYTVEVEESWVF